MKDGDGPVAALDQHALGELELEIAGLEARCAQGGLDGTHETGTAELLRRDVYGEPQPGERGVAPDADLPAALGEREFPEGMDEVGILRHGDELPRRDPSALPVVPTHQRFDSHDTPVGEHDL